MNILDSFMVALGFQVDDEAIDKLKEKSEELRNTALKLGAVFTGAAIGVGLFVEHVAKGMGEIQNFYELNQVTARSIEALSIAGIDFDITAEGMRESVAALNRKIGEAATGIGRGKIIFEKLGLSARDANGHVRTTDEMLEILAGRMQHLSRQENIAIAERLGLDPKMVLMLEQGADAFKKMREEADKLNPFSAEDYEVADKLDKMFIKVEYMLGLITKRIAVQLMPMVLKVTSAFLEWLKKAEQSEKFKTIFKVISDVLGTLTEWVFRLIAGTTQLIEWFSKFKVLTYGLLVIMTLLVAQKLGTWFIVLGEAIMDAAKAMTALDAASLPLTWQAVLIGAIALAVGLLIDDIWNWYHGNQSLFGDLLKKFPWLLNIVQTVGDVFQIVSKAFMDAWGELKGPVTELGKAIWDLIQVLWPVLWPIIKMIFGAVGLELIMQFIVGIQLLVMTVKVLAFGLKLVAQILGVIVDSVAKGIRGVVDLANKISSLPGVKQAISLVKGGAELAANAFSPDNLAPQLAFAGGGAGVIGKAGNSFTNNKAQTIVHSRTEAPITVLSNDPKEAGKNVKEVLDKRERQTIRNGQSAVAL